jgi:hypothetical protein
VSQAAAFDSDSGKEPTYLTTCLGTRSVATNVAMGSRYVGGVPHRSFRAFATIQPSPSQHPAKNR